MDDAVRAFNVWFDASLRGTGASCAETGALREPVSASSSVGLRHRQGRPARARRPDDANPRSGRKKAAPGGGATDARQATVFVHAARRGRARRLNARLGSHVFFLVKTELKRRRGRKRRDVATRVAACDIVVWSETTRAAAFAAREHGPARAGAFFCRRGGALARSVFFAGGDGRERLWSASGSPSGAEPPPLCAPRILAVAQPSSRPAGRARDYAARGGGEVRAALVAGMRSTRRSDDRRASRLAHRAELRSWTRTPNDRSSVARVRQRGEATGRPRRPRAPTKDRLRSVGDARRAPSARREGPFADDATGNAALAEQASSMRERARPAA